LAPVEGWTRADSSCRIQYRINSVYAPKSNASELRIGDAGYFTAIDLIFISMCQFQVTFFPIVASQGAPTNN
jgi:hypothetical protein